MDRGGKAETVAAAYAVTVNGRLSMELKSSPSRSIDAELHRMLSLLDGELRFAFLLWRLPDGVSLERFNLKTGPTEYLQCAGGFSGRFVCETRWTDPEGITRHESIGRGEAEVGDAQYEKVRWSTFETTVRSSEVLSLDEIIELFDSYLAVGEIPASYRTRQVVL